MKKKVLNIVIIIAILAITLFTLTGCNTNKQLDLVKVKEQVNQLTGDELDLATAENNILELKNPDLSSTVPVYDYDFDKYGLDIDNMQEMGYRFGINEQTKDIYAIFLPAEGKKEALKQQMDAYIEKIKNEETNAEIKQKLNNKMYEEYQGYIIYIVSDNNKEVLNTIKNSKTPILSMMTDVTTENMENIIGVKPSDVQEFLMQMPMMIVHSNTYIVVKPAEGKKEAVKTAIYNYMTLLEQQWLTYLPAQYDIVKNRMVKEYGEYLIYIATTDNQKVYDTIIKATK